MCRLWFKLTCKTNSLSVILLHISVYKYSEPQDGQAELMFLHCLPTKSISKMSSMLTDAITQ